MSDSTKCVTRNSQKSFLRKLRISLKNRPKILKLILKMRQRIREKQKLIIKLQNQLTKETERKLPDLDLNVDSKYSINLFDTLAKENDNLEVIENNISRKMKDKTTQTDDLCNKHEFKEAVAIDKGNKLQINETAWNTNSNKEDGEKSIAEQVKEVAQSALQQSGMVYVESAGMYYDYKTGYYYNSELGLYYHTDTECYYYYSEEKQTFVFHSYPDRSLEIANASLIAHEKKKARKLKRELKTHEDIDDLTKNLSQVSLRGRIALDSVVKHHPPCMRIIVRETNLSKLKVGSLYLITKDGGTVGREGEQHTILIKDQNVSRNHLDIKYNIEKKTYTAIDLGSKNGTILNGIRMCESQVISEPKEILHGSTIQLGETKLLCHIHPGNDTCGHCEPGLLMETQEKEKKVAYTRTCSVQKQHQLELARLKNKYAKKLLAIDETAYNDRAQTRRETVGSSHYAEKTQSTNVDTFIAPENKGFKLLEKMGWSKGEGLGKDNQGDTEPVPLISNEGKSGLGTPGATSAPPSGPTILPKKTLGPATMRLAARTKMLQPPAKAFQDTLDYDDSE